MVFHLTGLLSDEGIGMLKQNYVPGTSALEPSVYSTRIFLPLQCVRLCSDQIFQKLFLSSVWSRGVCVFGGGTTAPPPLLPPGAGAPGVLRQSLLHDKSSGNRCFFATLKHGLTYTITLKSNIRPLLFFPE